MLSPFVIAFVIAYLLKRPVIFLSRKLHLPRKPAAVLLVLVFYSTIGLLISLLGIRAFSTTRDLVMNLPQIYAAHVEPVLTDIFGNVEQGLKKWIPRWYPLWRIFSTSLSSLSDRWFPAFP